MALYYCAMWGALALICGYILFRPKVRFPVQKHSWLRYKPGTWIKRRIDIDNNGTRSEEAVTLTLKGIRSHRYQIEESRSTKGMPPQVTLSERENSIAVDDQPVHLPGRSYDCSVWAAWQRSQGVTTSLRFFVPKGQDSPVGITFEDPSCSGKLVLAAEKEQIVILGSTFTCARLEGEVRFGELTGTMTVWHCPDVPGSEVRSRMSLRGKDGELVNVSELIEVHEMK